MPKRIAVNSITVYRGGKRVVIKPKQAFDFTDAELDDIKKIAPDSVKKLEPESPVVEVKVPTDDNPKTTGGGKASGGKNKGAQKPEGDKPEGDKPEDDADL